VLIRSGVKLSSKTSTAPPLTHGHIGGNVNGTSRGNGFGAQTTASGCTPKRIAALSMIDRLQAPFMKGSNYRRGGGVCWDESGHILQLLTHSRPPQCWRGEARPRGNGHPTTSQARGAPRCSGFSTIFICEFKYCHSSEASDLIREHDQSL